MFFRSMSMTTESRELRIPAHIAIIMDGNGRWAREQEQLRLFGHRAGVRSVREVVESARSLGVRLAIWCGLERKA